MKAHLFILYVVMLVTLALLPQVSQAVLPCLTISEGETEDSYRVVISCNSDDALAAMEALYAGCVELGSRETETGYKTILSCDFIDAAEYEYLVNSTMADDSRYDVSYDDRPIKTDDSRYDSEDRPTKTDDSRVDGSTADRPTRTDGEGDRESTKSDGPNVFSVKQEIMGSGDFKTSSR